MKDVFGGGDGELAELNFVRRAAGADRHTVTLTWYALKISDQKHHKVGRHPGCVGEANSVLPRRGTWGIGSDVRVGDASIPLINDQADVESGLVGGLIETRKRATRIRRFKLRDGIVALAGL